MITQFCKWILVVSVSVLLISCASIGPRKVITDRGQYNNTVQQTDEEQLLKNIVRLHYLEPVSFLKVTNITASYSAGINGNAVGSYTDSSAVLIDQTNNVISSIVKSLTLSGNGSYNEVPTISYAPIDNAEFISALLTPIKLQDAFLLSYGGIHDTTLIVNLIAQAINGIGNARAATSPEARFAPQYTKFYEILDAFKTLDDRDMIRLHPTIVNNRVYLVMTILPPARYSPAARRFRQLLSIPQNKQSIIIVQSPVRERGEDVAIETRSILGIMSFLSHGVITPPEDIKKGYVAVTRNPDGTIFDWHSFMRGLMTIYYSSVRPSDAFVATPFRGYWFYIKDSDLDSKITFNLLISLLAMTSGRQVSPGPNITLPSPVR